MKWALAIWTAKKEQLYSDSWFWCANGLWLWLSLCSLIDAFISVSDTWNPPTSEKVCFHIPCARLIKKYAEGCTDWGVSLVSLKVLWCQFRLKARPGESESCSIQLLFILSSFKSCISRWNGRLLLALIKNFLWLILSHSFSMPSYVSLLSQVIVSYIYLYTYFQTVLNLLILCNHIASVRSYYHTFGVTFGHQITAKKRKKRLKENIYSERERHSDFMYKNK